MQITASIKTITEAIVIPGRKAPNPNAIIVISNPSKNSLLGIDFTRRTIMKLNIKKTIEMMAKTGNINVGSMNSVIVILLSKPLPEPNISEN